VLAAFASIVLIRQQSGRVAVVTSILDRERVPDERRQLRSGVLGDLDVHPGDVLTVVCVICAWFTGPKAAVQAHLDAWAPSTYTAEGYGGVRQTAAYRGDLHILMEAPDGRMASSTIMWLDEADKTAEFEPVESCPG
jgi:hypothetical protein